MTKKVAVLISAAASFLVGSGLGWWVHADLAERDVGLVAIVREAEVAGLCANALGAADEGRSSALRVLLEMRMANAVAGAADRLDRASPIRLAIPNLIEGVRRAHRYAVAK